jgi:hypothetical protein
MSGKKKQVEGVVVHEVCPDDVGTLVMMVLGKEQPNMMLSTEWQLWLRLVQGLLLSALLPNTSVISLEEDQSLISEQVEWLQQLV